MTPASTRKAIAANIEVMGELLLDAVQKVGIADEAISKGEQNQAIGAMHNIEQDLEYALALYRAAIALHRAGRAP